ncbi:hypothetical protein EYF80_007238 [Liparis tanakae]|uniref:Uncharacterized protein n=1 Tax=Liparis tanakae TaxID=230148 RepID=A0A4Z2IYY8_9TELE|nr:hypothetical protein EYF80_007238 [Liparis tanakae]
MKRSYWSSLSCGRTGFTEADKMVLSNCRTPLPTSILHSIRHQRHIQRSTGEIVAVVEACAEALCYWRPVQDPNVLGQNSVQHLHIRKLSGDFILGTTDDTVGDRDAQPATKLCGAQINGYDLWRKDSVGALSVRDQAGLQQSFEEPGLHGVVRVVLDRKALVGPSQFKALGSVYWNLLRGFFHPFEDQTLPQGFSTNTSSSRKPNPTPPAGKGPRPLAAAQSGPSESVSR